MELKRLWNEMKEALRISDEIDAVYEATDLDDPDFDRIEEEWEAAYKTYYEAMTKVTAEIKNLIGCDEKTARAMIHKKSDLIESLMNRVA